MKPPASSQQHRTAISFGVLFLAGPIKRPTDEKNLSDVLASPPSQAGTKPDARTGSRS
ncbi:MAG: hypothetical protein INR71_14015, partial [Terriglobus roseus]|nr:hypothetical protein [Terriglobus roseus]